MNIRRVTLGELNENDEVYYSTHHYPGENEINSENGDLQKVTVVKCLRGNSAETIEKASEALGYSPSFKPNATSDWTTIKYSNDSETECWSSFLWR